MITDNTIFMTTTAETIWAFGNVYGYPDGHAVSKNCFYMFGSFLEQNTCISWAYSSQLSMMKDETILKFMGGGV